MAFEDHLRKCSAHSACAQLAGDCCPTATGVMLTCCEREVVSQAWAWLSLTFSTTLIVLGLIFFVRVLPGSPAKFRREVSVAVTSGMVYLLMTLPFFLPQIWEWFPTRLQGNYVWLPFWYAFVLTKFVGSFFEVATYSAAGTMVSVFAMVFLNYLLPGGAGLFSETATAMEHSWTRWLGEGYKPWVAWLFSACFVYGIFLSRWNVCMKQYALGMFATLIVDFMNPETSASSFRAILWNYHFQWNWDGSVLSQVYMVMIAIPLAALSLPVVPCWRRWRRFFSLRAVSGKVLAKVSADTWGCLDRLITYFQQDTAHFDTESSYLFVRQLGKRRSDVEAQLAPARWECWNERTRRRLRGLHQVSGALRDLRQALRVQLEQVRGIRDCAAQVYTPAIREDLIEFLDDFSDGMAFLMSFPTLQRGLVKEDLDAIRASADAADDALIRALEKVPRGHRRERIFVDNLRNFPVALKDYVEVALEDMKGVEEEKGCRNSKWWDWLPRIPACNLYEWLPHHVFFMKEQHMHAIRNTCSWLVALCWCMMVQRATCVTTVSFIFSPSLGSLFDRNVNRILGVGIGLALGNLPAVILLKQECYDDNCFVHYPQGLIVYLQLMYAQWVLATYGYLATGSKYSYACLLWAGFGGVQMLRSLHTPYGRHSQTSDSVLFQSTMDNMLGCFIVFAVDIIAAHCMRRKTTDQVAIHVARCLETSARIIREMRDADCLEDVKKAAKALKTCIEESRYWDEEAHKEDTVWTSARMVAYKGDMVDALLRYCDDVYVSTWSLVCAVERSGQGFAARAIVRELLPEVMANRFEIYGRVVCASLKETSKSKKSMHVESVAPDEDADRSLRISDSLAPDPVPPASELPMDGEAQEGEGEEGPVGGEVPAGEEPPAGEGGSHRVVVLANQETFMSAGLSVPTPGLASTNLLCGSTALTVHADCIALRRTMRQIQAMLEEHTFWSAKEWRPPTEDVTPAPGVRPGARSRSISGSGSSHSMDRRSRFGNLPEDDEDDEDDREEETAETSADSSDSTTVVTPRGSDAV